MDQLRTKQDATCKIPNRVAADTWQDQQSPTYRFRTELVPVKWSNTHSSSVMEGMLLHLTGTLFDDWSCYVKLFGQYGGSLSGQWNIMENTCKFLTNHFVEPCK